ncbi:MAG: hypothetical protein JNM21_02055 [Taibaiella sp.]|nr:hypothetical protein [Taibaiella sp.]
MKLFCLLALLILNAKVASATGYKVPPVIDSCVVLFNTYETALKNSEAIKNFLDRYKNDTALRFDIHYYLTENCGNGSDTSHKCRGNFMLLLALIEAAGINKSTIMLSYEELSLYYPVERFMITIQEKPDTSDWAPPPPLDD